MLAAVVPFAIESGMVTPRGEVTTLRVLHEEHRHACATSKCRRPAVAWNTPAARASTACPARRRRSTSAFLDTAGSVCGALFPTGNLVDRFDGVDVTCIDNGMPVVVMLAADLGVTRL